MGDGVWRNTAKEGGREDEGWIGGIVGEGEEHSATDAGKVQRNRWMKEGRRKIV